MFKKVAHSSYSLELLSTPPPLRNVPRVFPPTPFEILGSGLMCSQISFLMYCCCGKKTSYIQMKIILISGKKPFKEYIFLKTTETVLSKF